MQFIDWADAIAAYVTIATLIDLTDVRVAIQTQDTVHAATKDEWWNHQELSEHAITKLNAAGKNRNNYRKCCSNYRDQSGN